MGNSIGSEVLDRLFAPHGASAYFRHIRGERDRGPGEPASGPRPSVPEAGRAGRAGAGVATMATSGSATVTFSASGIEVPANGSLLETAEAAGLNPRFRCRRGICGTCTTPKLSGSVVDVRTGETSEGAEPIRLCVSEARGEVCIDL